jgi:hypothetical protein
MNVEVQAALVAGAVAAIVCVVNNFVLLATARKRMAADRSIEVLRGTLATDSGTRKLRDDSFAASMASLGSAAQSIQAVRDMMHLILSARRNSMQASEALALSKKVRDELVRDYGEAHSSLSELERGAFHSSKSIAVNIHWTIHEALANRRYAAQLSDVQRARLLEDRQRLFDLQQTLDHCRMNRLSERLTSVQ